MVLDLLLCLSRLNQPKVLGRLWRGFAIKTHHNASKLLITMCNVKVHLVSDLGPLGCLGRLSKVDKGEGKNQHQRDDNSL